MAIVERELPASGQWEVKATGNDIPKLMGQLYETGNKAWDEAYHKNQKVGWEQITDPSGSPTWVKNDQVEEARSKGYGRTSETIRMVMPEVPWKQNRLGPGKWTFKKDPETGVSKWFKG